MTTTRHVADVPCIQTTSAPPCVHVVVRDGCVELIAEPCFLTSEQALRVARGLIQAVRETDSRFDCANTETMLHNLDP